MNLYMRALSSVALLGMALAAMNQYRPAWAARMGMDWWSLPELQAEVRDGQERSAELGARSAAANARLTGKNAVIEAFRAGRLTLLQAAARFRDINETRHDSCASFAGATAEERLCRQVISWAEAAARDESLNASQQTRRRLGAELDALLERNHGIIRLPD
jgi:hypothetical protein